MSVRDENSPLARDPEIDDQLKRFRGFDVPEGKINLAVPENAGRLGEFGIPPRPVSNNKALEAWNRAFGKDLELKKFIFQPEVFKNTKYRTLRRQIDTNAATPSRFETSRNWAGAYITANEGKHFVQIWGFWTIPNKLSIPVPPFSGQPGVPYLAANWIGLDGQRLYLDSSLPQLITQASLDVPTGEVTATTWIQWWARDDPGNKPTPIGLNVSPNDSIAAVLTVIDSTTVLGVMVNLTQAMAISVTATPPTVTLRSGAAVKPEIEGATAEWIVERSTVVGQTTQNNLADYDETEFDACLAIEADLTNLQSLPSGIAQTLSGAREIRMLDVLPDPTRTAFISMPHKVDDTTLRVRYGGF